MTNNKKDYRRHCETSKHLKNNGKKMCKEEDKYEQFQNKLEENTLKEFYCEFCLFETDNKKDYHRHLDSLKHIKKQEEINERKKFLQDLKKKKEMLANEEEQKRKKELQRLSIIENDKLQEEIISKCKFF
jgi:uncharacterized membrane protein YgaE (UPF0421/DUF939 family)